MISTLTSSNPDGCNPRIFLGPLYPAEGDLTPDLDFIRVLESIPLAFRQESLTLTYLQDSTRLNEGRFLFIFSEVLLIFFVP